MFKEPITAITDTIIFLLEYTLAIILITLYVSGIRPAGLHRLIWGCFFFANGLGASFGIITHGLDLSKKWDTIWSKVTISILGISMYFLIMGAINLYSSELAPKVFYMPLIYLALYLIIVFFRYHFLIFVIYSFVGIIVSLVFYFMSLSNGMPVYLIIAGLFISILAGMTQGLKIKLPPLNHNDLFHVIQIAGILTVFAGIILI